MPTSVLLAVLAAAGLLALAPALVRRYDAAERLVAERAQSTARVLQRRRRRRTVPGRRPVNPARALVVTLSEDPSSGQLAAPVSGPPAPHAGDSPDDRSPRGAVPTARSADPASAGSAEGAPASRRSGRPSRLRSVTPAGGRPRRRPDRRRQHTPAVYRRRRVLAALVLLNAVELVGVLVVGPGFWISFTVTGTLLVVYVVHLRARALADRRRRRARAREAAWLAARQAEVRREQARRAAARREAQRRLAAQRESVRRSAMGLDRPADLPQAASGGSVSYRRAGGLRGRPYEAGRGSHSA
ncbi:divisome protein SepX/GlpR [Verrucosispora sp. TAA-831]|uniref:divisome protein SepX/GlpR n=1 Tax=Verrucosispora sp. TAA-831 TaxID=3422227 RepID=UPI003D6FCCB4